MDQFSCRRRTKSGCRLTPTTDAPATDPGERSSGRPRCQQLHEAQADLWRQRAGWPVMTGQRSGISPGPLNRRYLLRREQWQDLRRQFTAQSEKLVLCSCRHGCAHRTPLLCDLPIKVTWVPPWAVACRPTWRPTTAGAAPKRHRSGRHGTKRLNQAHHQTDATTCGCRAQPGACNGPYAFSPSPGALHGRRVHRLIGTLNRPAADLPGESIGMGSHDAGLHTN